MVSSNFLSVNVPSSYISSINNYFIKLFRKLYKALSNHSYLMQIIYTQLSSFEYSYLTLRIYKQLNVCKTFVLHYTINDF